MAGNDNRKGIDVELEQLLERVRAELPKNDLAVALASREMLRLELAAARAEIAELKQALVTMCDVYSSNRSEKHRVKAFRKHAAASAPFSMADVAKTFEKLETGDDKR